MNITKSARIFWNTYLKSLEYLRVHSDPQLTGWNEFETNEPYTAKVFPEIIKVAESVQDEFETAHRYGVIDQYHTIEQKRQAVQMVINTIENIKTRRATV